MLLTFVVLFLNSSSRFESIAQFVMHRMYLEYISFLIASVATFYRIELSWWYQAPLVSVVIVTFSPKLILIGK